MHTNTLTFIFIIDILDEVISVNTSTFAVTFPQHYGAVIHSYICIWLNGMYCVLRSTVCEGNWKCMYIFDILPTSHHMITRESSITLFDYSP